MSRARHLLTAAALVLTVAAFPLSALASHQFDDVPDNNPFHADISALVTSGVTSGCGGRNFCPSAFVTREQMAAFMNRLGALAVGKTPVVNADKLDGLDSTDFASAAHTHTGVYLPIAGKAADSDKLDGLDSTDFARSNVAVTGHVNCLGSDLSPYDSTIGFTTSGVARYLTSGTGYLSCNVSLPDGATVTALDATVFDNTATAGVDCDLTRGDTAGATVTMATTPNTGDVATPGTTTATDDTVVSAVIDNILYGYTARCFLPEASSDLTVILISVEYTVQGLPVE